MKPTQINERYSILDVLRGFALCGVMIANMNSHSGYFMLPTEAQAAMPHAAADNIVMWFVKFFTDGKFYSIFSLLFGIGFGLQMKRAMDKGEKFGGLFRRRLWFLLLFGILHGVLFYVGDILAAYAILGFALLLFSNVSNKNLVRWSVFFLVLPVFQYLISWVPAQFSTPPPPSGGMPFEMIVNAYRSPSLLDDIMMNTGGLVMARYPEFLFTGQIFKVFAMFLLGYFVARKEFFVNLPAHNALFRKMVIWGALIGIPANIVLAQMYTTNLMAMRAPLGIVQPLAYLLGVPALAFFYTGSIALLYQKSTWKSILNIFAPFGRMALTNYLMQSVIASLIFTSNGLELYAATEPVYFVSIGFGILLFQIPFSAWWLNRFRYGPMEWAWRSLTYRKRQPMRKEVLA